MREVEVLVIALATSSHMGVYEEGVLIDRLQGSGKTSHELPLQFAALRQKYAIKTLIYVNGPGSFMSIKVAYIFLKSYAVAQGIALKGVDAYHFNAGSPIKAVGNKYFVKTDNGIVIRNLEKSEILSIKDFSLPNGITHLVFSPTSEPIYSIPAV
jgi:tRNA A37 threonylcarbamoyladenosine modification protein TsaB